MTKQIRLKALPGGLADTVTPRDPSRGLTFGDIMHTPEVRAIVERNLTPEQKLRRRRREAREALRRDRPDDVRLAEAAKKRGWTAGEVAFALEVVQDAATHKDLRERILAGKADPVRITRHDYIEHPDTVQRHRRSMDRWLASLADET